MGIVLLVGAIIYVAVADFIKERNENEYRLTRILSCLEKNEFEDKYTDKNLEEFIILNTNSYKYKNDINEYMRNVYQCCEIDTKDINSMYEIKSCLRNSITVMSLLAHEGKIPWNLTSLNISFPHCKYAGCMTGKWIVNYMRWWAKTLEENGCEATLVFIKYRSTYPEGELGVSMYDKYPNEVVEPQDVTAELCGFYTWKERIWW